MLQRSKTGAAFPLIDKPAMPIAVISQLWKTGFASITEIPIFGPFSILESTNDGSAPFVMLMIASAEPENTHFLNCGFPPTDVISTPICPLFANSHPSITAAHESWNNAPATAFVENCESLIKSCPQL